MTGEEYFALGLPMTYLFFEISGYGPCGEGGVGLRGEKDQPVRVPYCR